MTKGCLGSVGTSLFPKAAPACGGPASVLTACAPPSEGQTSIPSSPRSQGERSRPGPQGGASQEASWPHLGFHGLSLLLKSLDQLVHLQDLVLAVAEVVTVVPGCQPQLLILQGPREPAVRARAPQPAPAPAPAAQRPFSQSGAPPPVGASLRLSGFSGLGCSPPLCISGQFGGPFLGCCLFPSPAPNLQTY